jgi:hypothetical protein
MSVCVMWLAAHARSVGGGSGRRGVGGARRDRLDALLSSAIRCSTSACRRWSASICTISPRRFGDVGARHSWGSQYGIGVHASPRWHRWQPGSSCPAGQSRRNSTPSLTAVPSTAACKRRCPRGQLAVGSRPRRGLRDTVSVRNEFAPRAAPAAPQRSRLNNTMRSRRGSRTAGRSHGPSCTRTLHPASHGHEPGRSRNPDPTSTDRPGRRGRHRQPTTGPAIPGRPRPCPLVLLVIGPSQAQSSSHRGHPHFHGTPNPVTDPWIRAQCWRLAVRPNSRSPVLWKRDASGAVTAVTVYVLCQVLLVVVLGVVVRR